MNPDHTSIYPTTHFADVRPERRVPGWAWALAFLALAAGIAMAVVAVEYDGLIRSWFFTAAASEPVGSDGGATSVEPADGPDPTDTEDPEADQDDTTGDSGDDPTTPDTTDPGDSGPSGDQGGGSSPTPPAAVDVPNVNGMSRAEAEQAIWSLELSPVAVFDSDGGSAGIVIGCDVCGTSAQRGSTVTLTVSAMPAPDVTGMTESSASNAISNAGLTPYAVYGSSSTIPAGSVYDQDPVGSVPSDGVVLIWVSTGP